MLCGMSFRRFDRDALGSHVCAWRRHVDSRLGLGVRSFAFFVLLFFAPVSHLTKVLRVSRGAHATRTECPVWCACSAMPFSPRKRVLQVLHLISNEAVSV